MAVRNGWKTLRPEEQFMQLIRDVRDLKEKLRFLGRTQGVRLESRKVGGERRLYAVIEDETASNDGAEYQLAP